VLIKETISQAGVPRAEIFMEQRGLVNSRHEIRKGFCKNGAMEEIK